MSTRTRLCLAAVLLATVTIASAAETKEFKGDSTDGWLVFDLKANAQANDKLKSSEGSLHLKYDRATIIFLAHMTPITDLKEIKMVLKSDVDATVAFFVEDQDKAKFNYPVELKAGEEKTVTVKPEDFKLNDDSPVKKDKVEPARLGGGYGVIDLGPLFGATGDNTLHIKQVTITRG